MGLSNQERYGKIVWSIKNIKNLLNSLESGYPANDLKKYKDKLWPALLNSEGNSGYWVFGGGFDQTSFEGGFLYEILSSHTHNLDRLNDKESSDDNELYEIINRNIQVSGVLPRTESLIVQIYEWIENFYYAVNRYKDDFSDKFKDIKSLISNMKGELFEIMSCDPIYLRAYLLSKILKKVICPYSDDPVRKFIVDNWLYHDLKLTSELKTEVLWNIWKDIQFKNPSEIHIGDRFLYIITCMHDRLGSKSHMKDKIYETLREFVDSDELKKALDKCEESYKMKKQNEAEQIKQSDWCALTNTY